MLVNMMAKWHPLLQRVSSNMSKDIYSRLAEMIEDCSERVKICTPTDWYVDKQWSEDTITVVNTHKLIEMLQVEAIRIE